jgi:hypothetical protein
VVVAASSKQDLGSIAPGFRARRPQDYREIRLLVLLFAPTAKYSLELLTSTRCCFLKVVG